MKKVPVMDLTLLGSQGSASSSTSEPPRFITNHTNKFKYRKKLQILGTMVRDNARNNSRFKLSSIGILIYTSFQNGAQGVLEEKETKEDFTIGGLGTYPDRRELVDMIIELMETDSSS